MPPSSHQLPDKFVTSLLAVTFTTANGLMPDTLMSTASNRKTNLIGNIFHCALKPKILVHTAQYLSVPFSI